MPDITTPGGIVYPIASDPIAPLNGVFQDMAESTQVAIGRADLTTAAYRYVDTVYFTSSGTFTKATYPWLRAIRVRCVGGGGGGGGTQGTNGHGGGGGGAGGYAESFITDIAGLDASVTVTRGAGAAGGTSNVAGPNANASSFGSLVVGGGGLGTANGNAGEGGSATAGDFLANGNSGGAGSFPDSSRFAPGGSGGGSVFGGAGRGRELRNGQSLNGLSGASFGAGGGGGSQGSNSLSSASGGAGANGIVIVELYA
jgi:hypothetical protein